MAEEKEAEARVARIYREPPERGVSCLTAFPAGLHTGERDIQLIAGLRKLAKVTEQRLVQHLAGHCFLEREVLLACLQGGGRTMLVLSCFPVEDDRKRPQQGSVREGQSLVQHILRSCTRCEQNKLYSRAESTR